jgi:flagellar basal-body rod protein FlgB
MDDGMWIPLFVQTVKEARASLHDAANYRQAPKERSAELRGNHPFLRHIDGLQFFHNLRTPRAALAPVEHTRKARRRMLDKMVGGLDFQSKALVLRAERQRAIASNIANVDTPGYVARDFNFKDAMGTALKSGTGDMNAGSKTDSRHMDVPSASLSGSGSNALGYSVQSQPNLDNNTVDLDRERANFVDNAVRYEATLRFINGQAKTMLSAITGQ